MRSLVFLVSLYAGMTAIGLIALPAALFHQGPALWAVRVWARWAMFCLRRIGGVRLRLEGLEHIPPGPTLIACKHQSNLETIAAFLAVPDPAVVLKRELLAMPLYGWFAQRTGMIVVDREAHAKALRGMVHEAKQRLAEGRHVVIFPEGTRKAPGEPPDYKPGVAALYRELDVACVPAALNSGVFWGEGGRLLARGETVIRFLPPIPAGLPRREFMMRLEAEIEGASAELLAQAPAVATT